MKIMNSATVNPITVISKTAFSEKILKIIKENIVLRIIDKTTIPLSEYISYIKQYEIIDKPNPEESSQELESLTARIAELQTCTLDEITNEVYNSALIKIFVPFYAKHLKKNTVDCLLTKVFPTELRNFIFSADLLFADVVKTKALDVFLSKTAPILPKHPNEPLRIPIQTVRLNMAKILHSIIIGKFKKGKKVTSALFKGVPKDSMFFQGLTLKFFYKICAKNKHDYFVVNDDTYSLDFKIAVISLIDFIQPKNDLIFNHKINEYLNNLDFLSLLLIPDSSRDTEKRLTPANKNKI